VVSILLVSFISITRLCQSRRRDFEPRIDTLGLKSGNGAKESVVAGDLKALIQRLLR
jgi:hypothetical protein